MANDRLTRILLVDDHPAVRRGLAVVLAARNHEVTGEADTRNDALALLRQSKFDLAIVDLTLKEGSGLDLLSDLQKSDVPALVYSMHESPGTIERALNNGALGYVTKREEPAILLEGIEKVLKGECYVSPLPSQDIKDVPFVSVDGDIQEATLSPREYQILDLMGQGEMNSEIAESLNISARTVETYYLRLLEKLGLSNVKELRKFAISRRK